MGKLVHQGAELRSRCLAGKNGDPAAIAHTQRGCDGVLELKPDALGLGEGDQTIAERANLSRGAIGEGGKLGCRLSL